MTKAATKDYDAIVIGSGSGLSVASWAASQGLKVAVIDDGPFGGTCLNRGCIPSKLLIHSADVAETIRRSGDFGIDAHIDQVRFSDIMRRVSAYVDDHAAATEQANRSAKNIDVFQSRAEFLGLHELEVAGQRMTAEKIFVVAGARSVLPPIPGLAETPYRTSKEALRQSTQPKKMMIIGGGYIAAELGHFYGALGTEIELFQRGSLLIPNEDESVARTFTELFAKKYSVHTEAAVERVAYANGAFTVTATGPQGQITASGDALLVAAGIRPNTDLLQVEKAGLEVDKRGYLVTNEYLETSVPGIWAFGDIIGRHLFKHSANWEASYAVQNAFGSEKVAVDYTAMPHAIFSSPQVAGVGSTERDLKQRKVKYRAGSAAYAETAMGEALREEHGFVKALLSEDGRQILGCHIIGPEASILIHEVIVAMKASGRTEAITKSIHVHPALNEVVQRAFLAARKANPI